MNRAVFEDGAAYVLQAATRLGIEQQINSTVVTNGSILDDSLLSTFKKERVTVVVGLDGPEVADNKLRKPGSDAPSSEVVIANIKKMLAKGVHVCLSTALTPTNLSSASSFGKAFQTLGVKQFGFNLLRGKHLLQIICRSQLDDYYKQAVDSVVTNFLSQGDADFEYQMARRHKAFHGKPFFPTDCFAYGNQFVVHPDGTVNNCPFIPYGGCKLQDLHCYTDFLSLPEIQNFRKRLPLFNPLCQECDAKSICGGGCGWNTLELNGDLLAIDKGACLLTKAAFEVLFTSACQTTVDT